MTKYDPRKNAEGYNDPTPYAAEKHMMAQIRGKQARVAGGYFENTCACDTCVFYDNVIRRFTVEELEKLQGLPAGYTAAVPEPARKRAIGNGWTASVITEIFKLLPQAEATAKTDVA